MQGLLWPPLSRSVVLLLAGAITVAAAGCSVMMSAATRSLADSVSSGILNSDDPQTVRDGTPAYLILIDGMLQNDPRNESLLRAASTLNGAYASLFVEDVERRQQMADKALDFAIRALCRVDDQMCEPRTVPFDDFERWLATVQPKEVPSVYSLGTAWAGWIQVHAEDYNAVADIARVKAIMTRIAELDEGYDSGGPQLYLGVLETLLPAALGGHPELGRQHFERAIELSKGRNLMAKVLFAQQYARLVFDRKLHDSLLNDVLESDPHARDLTLVNIIAQRDAKTLLDDANDYF